MLPGSVMRTALLFHQQQPTQDESPQLKVAVSPHTLPSSPVYSAGQIYSRFLLLTIYILLYIFFWNLSFLKVFAHFNLYGLRREILTDKMSPVVIITCISDLDY